ncbi:AraC family transcriptional regulator [Azospirillum sp. HJ39]|uniref:AraC family transcriptional regulator n=1 Tax=Azospirillum sp. HJ39 TaxID=3159496 RepID=UPI003557B4C1
MDELLRLTRGAENRKTETGIPRVAMVQGPVPEHQLAAVYDPMINLILQGSKTMTVGDRAFRYDPATYFVMSIDLPAVGAVHPAADGSPYRAVSLLLEPQRIAALLADLPSPPMSSSSSGMAVGEVTPELLDAWTRLLRLMESPQDIPALAPAYEREILYRVLTGRMGWMLRDIATPDTTLARVNQAIQWLRAHYREPVSIQELADRAAMSVSAFHRRFKAVTALSPLQFQKRIRLLQARMLLVSGAGNATSVAFEVGYESATQFSREYTRFFGAPPARDAARVLNELRAREAA